MPRKKQRYELPEEVLAVLECSPNQWTVTASKPNFERLARFVDLLGVRSEGQYTPTASPGPATAPCAYDEPRQGLKRSFYFSSHSVDKETGIPITGGGIVQETVTFKGIIIGESRRVECEVQATKTTLDGDPPLFSGYKIMESDLTDRLPDGNYELLVNRERTRFSRDAGRFQPRPY
jgi:hypothetical protein